MKPYKRLFKEINDDKFNDKQIRTLIYILTGYDLKKLIKNNNVKKLYNILKNGGEFKKWKYDGDEKKFEKNIKDIIKMQDEI